MEYSNLSVDIRQRLGEAHEGDSLTVTGPEGYTGPLNTMVFRGSVEFYYRHAVGTQGSMFGMPENPIRWKDWTIEQDMQVQFEIEG